MRERSRLIFCINDREIAIRPLIEEGELYFSYYWIKITLDYILAQELAVWNLEKKWNVYEVIIGDRKLGNNGIMVAFVKLNSIDEIKELGTSIDLCGYNP